MKGMFSFFSGIPGDGGSSPRVTADELVAMVDGKEKITIIDVRTPAEFQGGHIPGSVSIPLNTLDNADVEVLGRIVVCCASGMRSVRGRELLTAKGFKDVVDLKGGIRAWANSGGIIVKG